MSVRLIHTWIINVRLIHTKIARQWIVNMFWTKLYKVNLRLCVCAGSGTSVCIGCWNVFITPRFFFRAVFYFTSQIWRDTLHWVELYTKLHDSVCSHFQMWMNVPLIMEVVNRCAVTLLVVLFVPVDQATSWMKIDWTAVVRFRLPSPADEICFSVCCSSCRYQWVWKWWLTQLSWECTVHWHRGEFHLLLQPRLHWRWGQLYK